MKLSKTFKSNRIKVLGGYGISHFITVLQPVIIVPLITRSLSVNDYGIYALYIVLFGFLIPLVSFNTSSFLMKEYHGEIENKKEKYISNFVLIKIVLLAILIGLAFAFRTFIVNLLEINSLFIVILALINTFFAGIIDLVKSQLRSEDNLKGFVTINVLSVTLIILLITTFYFLEKLTITWAISIHLLSFLIVASCGFFKVLGLSFNFLRHIDLDVIKRTLRFCWPLVLHSLSAKFFTMGDRFIINKFLDKESLGVYSASFQLAFGVSAAGSIVQMAWSPYIFKTMAKSKVINRNIKKNISLLFIGLTGFALMYMVAYPFVFDLYYPEKYASGLEYYYWFILGGMFQCFYWILNPFLMVFEKNIYFFRITLITSIFSLSFNFLMVKFGIEYLALSYFLSWILQVISMVTALFLISRQNNQVQFEQ